MSRARQFFDATVIAANIVAARFARLSALQPEGPDTPMAGKDREVEPLARPDRSLGAIAGRPLAAPAGILADVKIFKNYREARLENLRVGQT